MAVSTVSSALGVTKGLNEESQKVINRLNGFKSAEDMIGEYFGLRKEVIYSDDGQTVVDMVNEFRDPSALLRKKVRFVPYFAEKGMTREMFDKAVPPQFQPKEEDIAPKPANDGKRIDADSDGGSAPADESALPTPRKGT